MTHDQASVIAVCRDTEHRFSKVPVEEIVLLPGRGVEGDAHLGVAVQHRSRVKAGPAQPNLRQVHLIHAELFDEVAGHGFAVGPGELGENITTSGINLLALPRGTRLHVGDVAVVEITGLRHPCQQINTFQSGLLKHVLTKTPAGEVVRKVGVMSVVVTGGVVRPGDRICVEDPPTPHEPLKPV